MNLVGIMKLLADNKSHLRVGIGSTLFHHGPLHTNLPDTFVMRENGNGSWFHLGCAFLVHS